MKEDGITLYDFLDSNFHTAKFYIVVLTNFPFSVESNSLNSIPQNFNIQYAYLKFQYLILERLATLEIPQPYLYPNQSIITMSKIWWNRDGYLASYCQIHDSLVFDIPRTMLRLPAISNATRQPPLIFG